MKSVAFLGKQVVQLREAPDPTPGEGEVRLKVLLAGLCATDRHIVAGHFSVQPPRILGHELVGIVDAIGPEVPENWIGVKVGVIPARFCGKCAMCQSGNPQLCLNFECLGNTHDGGYAQFTIARSDQLIPLNEISEYDAVWLEPLACVIQALNQVGGKGIAGPVLIIGAGTLGMLMLETILSMTPAKVAVVDPNQPKIENALSRGAQMGWEVPRQGPAPETTEALHQWAPNGVPIVIDTTGVPTAIQRGIEWASPRGKVLLFGVSDPTSKLCISPHQVFSKELAILASSGMTPASFEAAVTLLREKRIQPSTLNAGVINLQDLPAYLLGEKTLPFGKVLISPWSTDTGK
jgi:D-arabinitol dehydrogenase (NADP+)